jgi:hypothetical protein
MVRPGLRPKAWAAADDLGDEGPGVERQCEPQGEELGLDREPADEIEALELGPVEAHRRAREEEGDHRRTDQDAEGDQQNRIDPARPLLNPPCVTGEPDRERDRGQQSGGDQPGAVLPERARQVEAAVREKKAAHRLGCVARVRQGVDHDPVPQQNLQQQRNVADRLDVNRHQLGDQPVRRQPQNPGDEAEHGRERDPGHRHQGGVQKPDQRRAGMGRARRIVDQMLIDVVARRIPQEPVAGLDPQIAQVADRVVDDPGHRQQQDDQGDDLDHQRTRALVGPDVGEPERLVSAVDCRHIENPS